MAMKTAQFSVDSAAILKEIERHFSSGADSDSPGIVLACNEIRVGLARLAKRAIEIGDEALLAELQRLGAVKPV